MGKRMAQQIERHAKIVDDPTIAEYVNRVGQNLVRNSDAKVPFTIKLIDSQVVNAFALPGGFFFVNAGLMLRAESESELASVMAHEIAHVAARHGTRQATRGQVVSLATIPLIFMGGWTGFGIRQAAGRSYPTVLIRDVRDADSGAVLANHLWFNRGRIWKKTRLTPGDTVEFEARAIEYRTGYWGPDPIRRLDEPPRADFKLTPPSGLRVILRRTNQGEAA